MYIKIKNIKLKIIVANTFKKRLIGLMNQKSITYGMLFPKCNSIHTFNMKSNIDIIGLDENNKIIYIYENLSKNKIIKIKYPNNLCSILELPPYFSKNYKLNEKIKFYE